MKIIRLSTFLDFGGIETKMANLSSVNDSNEWIFCSIGKGGRAADAIRANKKKVHCLALKHRIPNLHAIIALYKLIRIERPDVVHTSGAEANFHGVIAAWFARCPRIIAEEIGIPKQSKLARLIFTGIYKLTDAVVGESKIVVENINEKYSIAKRKVRIIPNFIAFPSENSNIQSKINGTVFTICSISRLEAVKNIEGVLMALHKVKEMGYTCKYIIAGNGSLETVLKEKVKVMNLVDDVVFLGYIDNPYFVLQQADLFVLNSFSEGFSNSLLEAMYSKTLVLTTKVGAASEVIRNGENGWIVPVDNHTILSKTIVKILNLSSKEKTEIARRAHTMVVENYTLWQHVSQLNDMYS